MAISSVLGSSALLPAGLGFRNLIINGDMRIAQRGTTGTAGGGTAYNTCDRWFSDIASLGTPYTESQETDAPNGFGNSLKVVPLGPQSAPSSTTKVIYSQKIEANNCAGIAKGTSSAKPLTLSFWVKANLTGVYAIEISDEVNTRSISKTYTVNASGVWEYKTIQIPADATGTIPVSTGAGLRLNFWIKAGTNFTTGTSGTWATTSSVNRAAGHAVAGNTTSDYWQLSGVQLEQNYQPTPFEQRPYGIELHLCMRYFQTYTYAQYQEMPVALGYAPSNYYYGAQSMRVPFRATPTVTFGSASGRRASDATLVAASNVYYNATADGAYFAFSCALSGYNAASFFISSTQTAEL